MYWPEILIPILVPITMFLAIAVPIYQHIVSRHRERMALIAKGIVTEEVKYLYTKDRRTNNPYNALKWGLIFVLLGVSLLLARITISIWGFEEAIYPAFISLGVGTALILFYAIALKRQREGEVV